MIIHEVSTKVGSITLSTIFYQTIEEWDGREKRQVKAKENKTFYWWISKEMHIKD